MVGFLKQQRSLDSVSDADTAASEYEALFIFDWDDTLMPTTFLSSLSGGLPPHISHALDSLGLLVAENLMEASTYGKVVIVTNAENGWIEMTAKRFFPQVAESLLSYRRVSARTQYESHTKSATEWKVLAFRELIEGSCIEQVISFGDSAHERDAAMRVASEEGVTCKSLKMMEKPDIDQLMRQHKLLRKCFEQMVDYAENLDLCITHERLIDERERVTSVRE